MAGCQAVSFQSISFPSNKGEKSRQSTGPNVLRREFPNQMRNRFFRPLATMTSLLLLLSVPTQASPIEFADVVNVMGDLHKSSQIAQLRVGTVAQDPNR